MKIFEKILIEIYLKNLYKKMKKTLTLILLTFLLFSCGEEEKIEDKKEKQDFFVETQKLDNFSGEYNIKKT